MLLCSLDWLPWERRCCSSRGGNARIRLRHAEGRSSKTPRALESARKHSCLVRRGRVLHAGLPGENGCPAAGTICILVLPKYQHFLETSVHSRGCRRTAGTHLHVPGTVIWLVTAEGHAWTCVNRNCCLPPRLIVGLTRRDCSRAKQGNHVTQFRLCRSDDPRLLGDWDWHRGALPASSHPSAPHASLWTLLDASAWSCQGTGATLCRRYFPVSFRRHGKRDNLVRRAIPLANGYGSIVTKVACSGLPSNGTRRHMRTALAPNDGHFDTSVAGPNITQIEIGATQNPSVRSQHDDLIAEGRGHANPD